MNFIDLSAGGEDWEGWYLGPWGRAKVWRLHAPDGASYHTCEIEEVRKLALEVGYLQTRIKELESLLTPGHVHFHPSAAATLRAAAAAIIDAMPRQPARQLAQIVDAGISRRPLSVSR
jgi:hypothetical protein